jgi:hypothetical protein
LRAHGFLASRRAPGADASYQKPSPQRQKVGLVQVFMGNEPLLIMDEPTTGLDPLMQREFLALVGEVRAAGRTVFLSSHNLGEAERACDRVAIIREGRIVAVESVEALRPTPPRGQWSWPNRRRRTFALADVEVESIAGFDVRLLSGATNPLLRRLATLDVRGCRSDARPRLLRDYYAASADDARRFVDGAAPDIQPAPAGAPDAPGQSPTR